MLLFSTDLIRERVEPTDIKYHQELVYSMWVPAYAKDELRVELFMRLIEVIQDITLTDQRLHFEYSDDKLILQRMPGGKWDEEIHWNDDSDNRNRDVWYEDDDDDDTPIDPELEKKVDEELENLKKELGKKKGKQASLLCIGGMTEDFTNDSIEIVISPFIA